MTFVAVPHAALSAVATLPRDARLAVLDLYERAYDLGYRPMPFTERELEEAWSMGRRAVRAVLDRLTIAGLVEVHRSQPGGNTPSTLRVVSPTEPGVGQQLNQDQPRPANQVPNHGKRRQLRRRDPICEPGSEPGVPTPPEPGPPPGGEPRAELYARVVGEKRREEIEPHPQPRSAGLAQAGPKVDWVKDRALANLAAVADREGDVAGLLVRFEAGEDELVLAWVRAARGTAVPGQPGRRQRQFADAPTGLRKRDIEAGLRLAASAWRARDGPDLRANNPIIISTTGEHHVRDLAAK